MPKDQWRRIDNLTTTTIRLIRGLILDIAQATTEILAERDGVRQMVTVSIFNPSLVRAKGDTQKQGTYYYEVFKAFHMIMLDMGLNGFDLENFETFFEFISIKVKTQTVVDIHASLTSNGFSDGDKFTRFFYQNNEDEWDNVLNLTAKAHFINFVKHNSVMRSLIELF